MEGPSPRAHLANPEQLFFQAVNKDGGQGVGEGSDNLEASSIYITQITK